MQPTLDRTGTALVRQLESLPAAEAAVFAKALTDAERVSVLAYVVQWMDATYEHAQAWLQNIEQYVPAPMSGRGGDFDESQPTKGEGKKLVHLGIVTEVVADGTYHTPNYAHTVVTFTLPNNEVVSLVMKFDNTTPSHEAAQLLIRGDLTTTDNRVVPLFDIERAIRNRS